MYVNIYIYIGKHKILQIWFDAQMHNASLYKIPTSEAYGALSPCPSGSAPSHPESAMLRGGFRQLFWLVDNTQTTK